MVGLRMYNFEVIDFKFKAHLQDVRETIHQQIISAINNLAEQLIRNQVINDISEFKLDQLRKDIEQYVRRRVAHLQANLNAEILFKHKLILLDMFATKKQHQMNKKIDLISEKCNILTQLLNAQALDRNEVLYKKKLKQETIINVESQKIEPKTLDKQVRRMLRIIRSDNIESKKNMELMMKIPTIKVKAQYVKQNEVNPQAND